jgi:hypothetical protein
MQQITCTNALSAGGPCGEQATLLNTQFIYRQEYTDGQFEQILSEIHYNIECPNCGRYTRMESASSIQDGPDPSDEPGVVPPDEPSSKRQLNGNNAGRQ